MASFLKREIRAAVREEVSRVFGSSYDSTPTTGTRDTDTASAITEMRTSITRNSQETSSTEDHTLSFAEFYALREEQRQEGFLPPPFPPPQKKKTTLGKSAVPAKSVDVEVKVGLASQVDGVFKS